MPFSSWNEGSKRVDDVFLSTCARPCPRDIAAPFLVPEMVERIAGRGLHSSTFQLKLSHV